MRVVFHAIDGTGLGHLQRACLVGAALGERVFGLEALVATNAADTSALAPLARDARFRILRLPYTNLDEARAGDDPTPRRVNAEAFLGAARAFEPDVLVFDTHAPKPILRASALAGVPRALLLRTVTSAAFERLAIEVLPDVDLWLPMGDLGAAPLPAIEPRLDARRRDVGPIVRPAFTAEVRAEARARFGIAADAPLVVATLGGGGGQLGRGKRSVALDAEAFAEPVVRGLSALARGGVRCVAQLGPYARSLPSAPGVDVLRFDPLFGALAESADLAVGLAGYNAVHELARAAVPALWLCKAARYESQEARARALEAEGAAMGVVTAESASDVPHLLELGWNDLARRSRVRSVLRAKYAQSAMDGAGAAAELIAALAGRAVPTLPGPGPCDEPCDACPVRAEGTTSLSPEALRARGERRVRVSCAEGRVDLAARLADLDRVGLVPIVETTGRMAAGSPAVGAALDAGRPRTLLLFGLGKKVHQRACHGPGTMGSTRRLAERGPKDGPTATWALETKRFGAQIRHAVRPVDRDFFFRRPGAESLPAVLILRKRWLPFSEVFAHREVTALRRHRPVVVCKDAEGDWPAVPRWPLGDLPPDRAASALAEAGVRVAHAVFSTCAASYLGLVRALEVPLVVSVRGHDLYRRADERAAQLARVFEAAAAILPRTEEMASDLRALGAPSEKLHVLPTPLDEERFAAREPPPRAGGLRVLSVGRFTAKKGLADVLRAFALLASRSPDARLDVVGRGHVDEDAAVVAELQALANEPPLAGRVRLWPAMPQEALARLYAESHVYLCAPRVAADGDREGLPNAVKEAMAVGLPIVATDHGALGELVRGDGDRFGPAGVVVAEGDCAALGEALGEVAALGEESLRPLLQAGRARVRARFAQSEIVEKLEALYEALCADRAAR